MNDADLSARIQAGEDSTLEFKAEDVNADSLAGELVAFANAYGGTLLIGVADDGRITGVSRSGLDDWVVTVCRDKVEPPPNPRLRWHLLEGKRVLEVVIGRGVEPYRTNRGVFYVRAGATKQMASVAEVRRLFQARGQVQHDESPVFGSTADDVDLLRFAGYYRRVYGAELDRRPEAVRLSLQKNGVLVPHEGELAPSVGGLLVFGSAPQQFLRMSGIIAVRYAGTQPDSDQQVSRQELSGPLPALIDQAMDFVRLHMLVAGEKRSVRRVEHAQYPLVAVREALVNAVAHRDYSLAGARTRLLMFADRLELPRPGRLPNTQTLEHLGLRPPFARNQLIVGFLQRLGYIEFPGEGILIMRREMRAHNGTEPQFAEAGEEFSVTLPA